MKVSQLREVFRVAERQYRSDHKQDAADALSTFAANLLRENDQRTVAALVARVVRSRESRDARKKALPAAPNSKRGKKKGHSRSRGWR
jgi:hypothetical protein